MFLMRQVSHDLKVEGKAERGNFFGKVGQKPIIVSSAPPQTAVTAVKGDPGDDQKIQIGVPDGLAFVRARLLDSIRTIFQIFR